MDKIEEKIKQDIINAFDNNQINYDLGKANYVDDIGECVIDAIIEAVKPIYEKASKISD